MRLRRVVSGGAVAVATLLGASTARAGVDARTSLQVTAEERYDDDFRLSATGEGTGQLMTKLTPRLGLTLGAPTLKLDAFYAAGLLVRHASGGVSFDHRAGLDLQKALSRRWRAESALRLYRVSDPTALPRMGVGASFDPVLYGKGSVALVGELTQRLDARVSYGLEAARVLSAGSQAGWVHTPGAELWYAATRRLAAGAEYRYQGFLFGDEFAQAHGGFLGLRYRVTRPSTLTLRAGPVAFRGPQGAGLLPRYQLEWMRVGRRLDYGATVGHDLVGASGFTSALWADFASAVFTWRAGAGLSFFGAANVFRNGRPPGQGAFQWGADGVSQGYAVGAGVEYRLARPVTLQGTVDRIAQVGGGGALAMPARNVIAVRAVVTAW